MKVYISFADEKFKKAQQYASKMAMKRGKVDKVIEYGPEDIDNEFYNKNIDIFRIKRGAGLWLWKPYIIYRTLFEMDWGDYLIYCDAGAYCFNDVEYLTNALDASGRDILCFDAGALIEYQYTKPEAFKKMGCQNQGFELTAQRIATYIVCKKSPESMKFFKEYLDFAQDIEILYDNDPTCSKATVEGFVAHREDQSIFSLLTKKYSLHAYRNPSQHGYGKGLTGIKALLKRKIRGDKSSVFEYPVIFIAHRDKSVTITTMAKVAFQFFLPGLYNILYYIAHGAKKP